MPPQTRDYPREVGNKPGLILLFDRLRLGLDPGDAGIYIVDLPAFFEEGLHVLHDLGSGHVFTDRFLLHVFSLGANAIDNSILKQQLNAVVSERKSPFHIKRSCYITVIADTFLIRAGNRLTRLLGRNNKTSATVLVGTPDPANLVLVTLGTCRVCPHVMIMSGLKTYQQLNRAFRCSTSYSSPIAVKSPHA